LPTCVAINTECVAINTETEPLKTSLHLRVRCFAPPQITSSNLPATATSHLRRFLSRHRKAKWIDTPHPHALIVTFRKPLREVPTTQRDWFKMRQVGVPDAPSPIPIPIPSLHYDLKNFIHEALCRHRTCFPLKPETGMTDSPETVQPPYHNADSAVTTNGR
jgi:hypothetical protein